MWRVPLGGTVIVNGGSYHPMSHRGARSRVVPPRLAWSVSISVTLSVGTMPAPVCRVSATSPRWPISTEFYGG